MKMGEANEEFEVIENADFDGTAFENPIVKIFRGYNVSNETVRNIRDSDIQQSDLAALSDDDLQRFGFKEASVRSLMLSEFPNSANQTLHYDKYIENTKLDQYQEKVYKNVHDQLQLMNKVMEASLKALQSNPIKYDKLVDDNVYVSSLNAKTMKEMLNIISRITNEKESNRLKIWMYSLAGLAVLGSLITLRKMIKL